MAHIHSVTDSNERFVIDPVTREITSSSAKKIVVMQYDHNSERFTFEIPKVDGHNMAICDKVEIHYINIDAVEKSLKSEGVYEVNDIQNAPDNNGVSVFSWLLSRNCTKYAGTLSFLIHFACTTDGVEDYAWNTAIFQSITIGNGMNNGAEVLEPFPDILAQWKAQLFSESETAVLNVTTAEAKALAAIEAAGEAKKQSVLDSIPDEYEALYALADQNHRNKAGAIVLDAQGESIVVNDASAYPLHGLKLFGKSTQDGTPTPDAPVDIVSVENPVVAVYGKNLINNKLSTSSNGGITYTTNPDGSVTINGTATNESYYKFDFQNQIPIKNVDLILSIKGGVGKTSVTVGYFDKDGNVTNSIAYTDNNEKLFAYPDEAEQTRTFLTVPTGTVCENVVVYPMIRLASVGDNTYEPYTEQTVETSHILPGIPVASGGNYTDADGQQWICDEVDLKRGVYIQRIKEFVLSDLNADTWYTWGVSHTTEGITGFYHYFTDSVLIDFVLCNIGVFGSKTWGGLSVGVGASANSKYLTISVDNSNLADVSTNEKAIESLKTLIADTNAKMYAVIEPIETPLSETEINAFKALHSNRPNTTILNDAGAFMAVSYVADTKTYIDNKIKELMEGGTE